MRNFIHSGDLGDVIYSLPTVRAMGGGRMFLCDRPGVETMHGMTRQRCEAIMPLLMQQSCIYLCAGMEPHPSEPDIVDLNKFRFMGFDLHRQNLADNYLIANGLPTSHRNTPWLRASECFYEPVVISRSARYHKPGFPWRRIVERMGQFAVFVGTPAEHTAFVQEFGSVRYAHTRTLLEAAEIINASELFIGNQSCPLAIAHGLGKRVLIEVCPTCPNCIFGREGEFTEYTDAFSITGPETVHVREPSRDRQGIRGGDSQRKEAPAAQDEEALLAWAGEGGAEARVS